VKTEKDVGGGPQPKRYFRPHRLILLALAWAFLGVGIVGVFLPLVPGTLFLILAGACFTRSSPRFEAWLLDHPRFGPPVRAWRKTGAIPRRGKLFAGASLAASWLILLASDAPALLSLATFAVFVGVGLFVATRPEG
jgi:uncharacterized membrane protein YbaN (DUF454 family)